MKWPVFHTVIEEELIALASLHSLIYLKTYIGFRQSFNKPKTPDRDGYLICFCIKHPASSSNHQEQTIFLHNKYSIANRLYYYKNDHSIDR